MSTGAAGSAMKQGDVAAETTNGAFEALEHESLSSKAYAQIRRALTTGELKPGQRLSGREIAFRFGTSLTPVREALLQLVAEGLLEAQTRQSITVPVPTRQAYLELRDIRVEVEGLGAQRAASLVQQAAVDDLAEIHSTLVSAKASGDYPLALRCNVAFHLGLCREARLPRLFKVVDGLWAQSGPFLTLLYSKIGDWPVPEGQHPHLKVLDALQRRDGEAARKAIANDILTGGAGMLRRLEEQQAP